MEVKRGDMIFQSTLPMRGATVWNRSVIVRQIISIHTPHAGSDSTNLHYFDFSVPFQSTLPMRGATGNTSTLNMPYSYFNPHSPCGERQNSHRVRRRGYSISIHTPHAGSDCHKHVYNGCDSLFQSTLPMRGATSCTARRNCIPRHFNPHSPCGERPCSVLHRMTTLFISIHTPHAGSDISFSGTGI